MLNKLLQWLRRIGTRCHKDAQGTIQKYRNYNDYMKRQYAKAPIPKPEQGHPLSDQRRHRHQ